MQSVWRKHYITSLEIWTIGLWTLGPYDYNLFQIDDYPAHSCTISPMAFLLVTEAAIIYVFIVVVDIGNTNVIFFS